MENYVLLVGPAIVLVAILYFAAVLLRDAIKRLRCPHRDVRLVRQQSGTTLYFAEVCMACGKASGAKP